MGDDVFLNYVPCPYCGGNLADMNHPCDEDARSAAAAKSVAWMTDALRAPVATATPDQLRRKLIECEDALLTTRAALTEAEAEIERLRGGVTDQEAPSAAPADSTENHP